LFGHNSTSIYIETINGAPFTENHVKDSSMFGKVSNVPEELAKWVKRMNAGCALCNKKKNYYRCTHPTPPPLLYNCNSKMEKVPYGLINNP